MPYILFHFLNFVISIMEDSHNGIAAVLKTAGRKPVGVRISHPPQNLIFLHSLFKVYNKYHNLDII